LGEYNARVPVIPPPVHCHIMRKGNPQNWYRNAYNESDDEEQLLLSLAKVPSLPESAASDWEPVHAQNIGAASLDDLFREFDDDEIAELECPANMFRTVSAFIASVEMVSSVVGEAVVSKRKLRHRALETTLRMHGAAVVSKLHAGVSHVIVSADNNVADVRQLRDTLRDMRTQTMAEGTTTGDRWIESHLVTESWVEACVEANTMLDAAKFRA
jgi:hypothetical protein